MNRSRLKVIAATAAITVPMLFGAATAGALDFGSSSLDRPGAPSTDRPTTTATSTAAPSPDKPGEPSSDQPSTDELRKLHDETNEIRKAAGKAPLKWDQKLADEAAKWSEQQVRDGKMHHDTGQTTGRYHGENVFMTQGGSAGDAVKAWRNSPGHYRNMIGDYATEGIGIATDGEGTYYVTQRFLR
ncbi:CAP domain-containing protein [Corynebacterium hansenii]|uniref:CAP domain-containing protein n=1 Tax=Corynebacterium hansenii TaxID=394964 RepID=A0ABV7ZNN6_9CORY|nr:CAP domain-containing protein [Corynebacterium hansenii]WJZ00770.1 Cysteine-rich secretory protein family protein [Corynebacterium hansenii]